MSEDQFNSFVEKVYQMHNLNKVPEVRMMKSDVKCPENWNFVNSIWNAGSMISSLGFSYTAPETFEGIAQNGPLRTRTVHMMDGFGRWTMLFLLRWTRRPGHLSTSEMLGPRISNVNFR